jgi:AcrR family transcriptional regulator
MASNKNISSSEKRTYRLKQRARRRDEVHHRITEAAVHFHGTVGPARTTMSAIAKRAGVRRSTVYNHFPTDTDLFNACSAHWFAANPPPDPSAWAQIDDPERRVRVAVAEMYDYYGRGQKMLGNVLRDAALLPALGEIMRRKWVPLMDGIVETLASGWPSADLELRSRLRLAISFFTWQTLTESGLPADRAATLASELVYSH